MLRSALMIMSTVRPACLVGLQMRLNSCPSLKPACLGWALAVPLCGAGRAWGGAGRGAVHAPIVGHSARAEFIVVGHRLFASLQQRNNLY